MAGAGHFSASKDRSILDAAALKGSKVRIEIVGSYRHGVEARNVVGRLERGTGSWLVVSTPVTSCFTSTGERGPEGSLRGETQVDGTDDPGTGISNMDTAPVASFNQKMNQLLAASAVATQL